MKLSDLQLASVYATRDGRRGTLLEIGLELPGGGRSGVRMRWDKPARLAGQEEVLSSRRLSWCCDRQIAEQAQDELDAAARQQRSGELAGLTGELLAALNVLGVDTQASITRPWEAESQTLLTLDRRAVEQLLGLLGGTPPAPRREPSALGELLVP